ncbi:MAG: hypothetical protein ABIJ96_03720 [Elusimicrobiota bacterium]
MQKPPLKSALRLALDMLARPGRALDRMEREEGALYEAAVIYAVYLATAVLFYTGKPADFPPLPPDSPLAQLEVHCGLFAWSKALAWHPLFTVILIAFAAWFARLLAKGHAAFKILLGCACACLPPAAVLAYTNSAVGKPLFAAAWAGLLAAMIPALYGMDKKLWRSLAALLMTINIAAVALLPVFAAAIVLRAPLVYHIVELAAAFWTVGLAAYGIRRLTGLQTARAFFAIILASWCQLIFIIALYLLGWIPKDALKALLAV